MMVMPSFFTYCMVMFDPKMLGERLWLDGVPMLGAAMYLGLITGAVTGYCIRREEKDKERKKDRSIEERTDSPLEN
jgi:hypothetical protein